jgi:uncharacterized membrane protein YfcA
MGIAYLWIGIAVISTIIAIICMSLEIKKRVDTGGFFIVFAAIVISASLVIIVANGYTIIACHTFPEKVILDYIRRIYNNSSSIKIK